MLIHCSCTVDGLRSEVKEKISLFWCFLIWCSKINNIAWMHFFYLFEGPFQQKAFGCCSFHQRHQKHLTKAIILPCRTSFWPTLICFSVFLFFFTLVWICKNKSKHQSHTKAFPNQLIKAVVDFVCRIQLQILHKKSFIDLFIFKGESSTVAPEVHHCLHTTLDLI